MFTKLQKTWTPLCWMAWWKWLSIRVYRYIINWMGLNAFWHKMNVSFSCHMFFSQTFHFAINAFKSDSSSATPFYNSLIFFYSFNRLSLKPYQQQNMMEKPCETHLFWLICPNQACSCPSIMQSFILNRKSDIFLLNTNFNSPKIKY